MSTSSSAYPDGSAERDTGGDCFGVRRTIAVAVFLGAITLSPSLQLRRLQIILLELAIHTISQRP
jgi:hypothetical protein